jgi:hypothetical protein
MKPITDTIREYRNGELAALGTQAMAEAVAAVRQHRKPATVTIKLVISPDKHSQREVEVQADVTTKLPKRGLKPATFFTGRDNELLRSDPDQTDFIDETTGEVTTRPLMSAVPTPAPRDGTDG